MRNAALSSTNIRDYVYKGKCLLPVQDWLMVGIWCLASFSSLPTNNGRRVEEEWRNRFISSSLLGKTMPPSPLLTNWGEEVAEQKISDVQNGWIRKGSFSTLHINR